MRTVYIIDVDATLHDRGEPLDPVFKEWFLNFQVDHTIHLVANGSYGQLHDRIGPEVLRMAEMVFTCCGNEIHKGKNLVHQSKWEAGPALLEELEHELEISTWREQTGHHIEQRIGSINFSVLGHDATEDQRERFIRYEATRFTRRSVITRLGHKFHNLDFLMSGQTSISILPKGQNKSRILSRINADQTIFLGDHIFPGSVNWSLAIGCTEHHRIRDWRELRSILTEITAKITRQMAQGPLH